MIRKLTVMAAASVAVCAAGAFSQAITFNGPMAWITQRNDSITVRAQLDTAQFKKKKEFCLSASLVNEQLQKKILVQKVFSVKDYTGEFALGKVGQNLVGGRSYIRIDWAIPGTASKGSILPIGIVALDKLPQPETMAALHVKEGVDAAAVVASVKDADFRSVGQARFSFVWNKEALFIVIVKQPMPGSVRFAIDGKNGKNAFLSFADRVIVYQTDKDSLKGLHFTRQTAGDSLKYGEKSWPAELTKSVSGDKVVIRIPWYDTGVIPFEERKMGLGIMTFDAKDQQNAALPATAKFFLPGTWCDLQLAK